MQKLPFILKKEIEPKQLSGFKTKIVYVMPTVRVIVIKNSHLQKMLSKIIQRERLV
jgi:hypothetical protein